MILTKTCFTQPVTQSHRLSIIDGFWWVDYFTSGTGNSPVVPYKHYPAL